MQGIHHQFVFAIINREFTDNGATSINALLSMVCI
jgi:hypothetical protein